MSKIAFYTLGCKVNQVETEQWAESFSVLGDQIVDFAEEADVYIINTCTVTHVADRKSRAVIRRVHRQHPEALLVVTGCMAQVFPQQAHALTGVNLIIGASYKDRLVDLVKKHLPVYAPELSDTLILRGELTAQHKLPPVIYTHVHKKTRAFIKIQDGCQGFCSFCIVPFARGPVRSKLPEDILQEACQLLQLGYREIVLTGIHTGNYGLDLPDWNLSKLLQFLEMQLEGTYRLRLSSLEPLEFNDDFLHAIKSLKNLCPHFHIPLQSGSNKILKAMNRRYSREYYQELIIKITDIYDRPALMTDVMVGFPGETKADFADTYDLLAELPFSDLHVFKYSPRLGTQAAHMPQQVLEPVKNERSAALLQLAAAKHQKYQQLFLGETLRVLVEREYNSNYNIGLTDNYLEVVLVKEPIGTFTELQITANYDKVLFGEKAPVRVLGSNR